MGEAAAHAQGTWGTRAITWADQVSIDSSNAVTNVNEFRSSKTHIRSFLTPTPASTGGDGSADRLPHLEGTRVYRQDVSPEIRRALEAIPNNRIEGCSVEAIERTGIQPWPIVTMADNVGDVTGVDDISNVYTFKVDAASHHGLLKPTDGKSNAIQTRASTDKYWKVGDILRVGDELRRVEEIASTVSGDGAGGLYLSSGFRGAGNSPKANDAGLKVYKQNMFEYRIKFESGCTHDSHCTANGIDSTDSDQDAWCSAGGVCRCSDTSPTGYWGYGCTKAGRANHGAPYKRSNSGNILSLKCDKSKLYSGMVIGTAALVKRSDPLTIQFDRDLAIKGANGGGKFAVGDEVYIDGQVRTVVKFSDSTVSVNEPFYSYDKSDSENIIPAHSWVYLLNRDSGTGIRCAATDMPHLKQSQHSCQQHAAHGSAATLTTNAHLANGPRILDDTDATYANYYPNGFTGQCEYTESQAWRVDSVDHGVIGSQTERTLGFHKSSLSQTNQEAATNTIRLLDPHEIHIGDRVRINTQKHSKIVGGYFQTRTVDALVRKQG